MDLSGNRAEGPSENQVVSVSEVSQRARAALFLPCKCCREQCLLQSLGLTMLSLWFLLFPFLCFLDLVG